MTYPARNTPQAYPFLSCISYIRTLRWLVLAPMVAMLVGVTACSSPAAPTGLSLPPGFTITAFAQGLNQPRFITFGPDGTLFVAESGANRVIAFPNPSRNSVARAPVVVADRLNRPTSLSFAGETLYVGESDKISRLTLGADHVATRAQTVVPDLPTAGGHTTRTVLVGPNNTLYVAIGSSCNDCVESDPHRAVVMTFGMDGSNGRVYARGLRNAVGIAVNPWNQQVWATNNGRDSLGDDTPPETIYDLHDGGNYGWPVCHAGNIIDPDLGQPNSCDGVIAPLVRMQAHSAPLGLAFYNAGQFPAAYHGLFVAFHGSWNRSVPTGYKVVYIPLNGRGAVAGAPQDFATGWLKDGNVSGRPVGLAVGPEGALYLSSDQSGVIYRITYTGR